MIYAQINEENICIVISDMGEVEASDKHLIPIETYDTSLLGKKYNNGVWEEVYKPEPEEPQPTNADILAEVKKSQQDIIDEYTMELINQGVL